MADDRKKAAKKGRQTRHARQRMLKDAQDFADEKQRMLKDAQDFADEKQRILKDAQDFVSNLSPAAQQEYANACVVKNNNVSRDEARQIYPLNEKPEARKKRLAKLKAWWRWFYHGE